MSLRDELDKPLVAATCLVRTFIDAQPNPGEWEELMDDASVQGAQLFRLMKKHGWDKGDSSLFRHRRGGCKCAT